MTYAQRLGRVLHPKADGRSAQFYNLVSLRTCEEDFARHRQLFWAEQGYSYQTQVEGLMVYQLLPQTAHHWLRRR